MSSRCGALQYMVNVRVSTDAGKEGVVETPIAIAPQILIEKVLRDAKELEREKVEAMMLSPLGEAVDKMEVNEESNIKKEPPV